MIFIVIIFFLFASQVRSEADRNPNYRWTVLPAIDNLDICNGNTCGNGSVPHTLCLASNNVSDCENFSMLPMEFVNRQKFVLMHNGLRNRIVRSKKSYAKNMNYLHWDQDLEAMARNWVKQCRIGERDACDYIYKPFLKVGQNHIFMKGTPGDDWELKAMSEWFLEIQQLQTEDYASISTDRANNFTQMMWASSQFLGCAGAKMFNGFFVTCYYHPQGNQINKPLFKQGTSERDACTECPQSRASCSRILTGLCGLDDKYVLQNFAAALKTDVGIIASSLVIFLIK